VEIISPKDFINQRYEIELVLQKNLTDTPIL
jgi:hypothetical protein